MHILVEEILPLWNERALNSKEWDMYWYDDHAWSRLVVKVRVLRRAEEDGFSLWWDAGVHQDGNTEGEMPIWTSKILRISR
jgi:hypothetical protein